MQEKPSTLSDQQSVAVTIYNENLALIKDLRRVTFEAGRNRLALREVSGRMRPETALLRSVSHPGSLSLLEQNFDFDLLTPAKLLEKYVGRNVRIIKTHPTTGAETITLRPMGETRTQIVAQLEADVAFLLPSDRHGQETLRRRLKADPATRLIPVVLVTAVFVVCVMSVVVLSRPGPPVPLVKGLVEAMGGRVWYEQARTGGADFRISLPVPRRS